MNATAQAQAEQGRESPLGTRSTTPLAAGCANPVSHEDFDPKSD